MMRLNKIIYCTTIFSIFTEAARYNVGFDLKLFYLVIFFNFSIFALTEKIKYSKGLFIFHAIIIFSGFFSIVFGYNKVVYFLVQLFFLILIPVYYFSFFKVFEFKLTSIISFYCKLSFWVSVIGIIKFPFDSMRYVGLHSIMLEPAHFCTIILPSFFITFKSNVFPRYFYKVILVSIILSGSSIGYIGLALGVILSVKKTSLIKTSFLILIVSTLSLTTYNFYPPLKLRIDDTLNSYSSGDLSSANLSTYALLSNFFVASKSFMSNPILGNGLGSHLWSREIYLKDIKGIEVFEEMGNEDLNKQDAGSLFSRLMSELGIVGILGVLYFICKFYVTDKDNLNSSYSIVSKSILVYFFLKLFREGHYFSPEMYFFVFLYVFNKYECLRKIKVEHLDKLKF